MLTKTKNFFNEVKVELQKASWPWDPKEKGFKKYKELSDSTVVVIIAMVLTATVFGAVTAYVASSRQVFSAPRAVGLGIFASIVVAMLGAT